MGNFNKDNTLETGKLSNKQPFLFCCCCTHNKNTTYTSGTNTTLTFVSRVNIFIPLFFCILSSNGTLEDSFKKNFFFLYTYMSQKEGFSNVANLIQFTIKLSTFFFRAFHRLLFFFYRILHPVYIYIFFILFFVYIVRR